MDKIEQIKNEIEKMITTLEKNCGYGSSVDSQIIILNKVLSFIEPMQEEKSKFDSAIQEGDDVRYNEDLGCRINLSQLKRVAKKPTKEMMGKSILGEPKKATGKLAELIKEFDELPCEEKIRRISETRVEMEMEVWLDRACKYLFDNFHGEKLSLRMIEDFRKAMMEGKI